MNYLSLDVGTTNCKCQLFSETGVILKTYSAQYASLIKHGETYVDVAAIWNTVKLMIAAVAKTHNVDCICLSSFGESFVALDKSDCILFDPMYYTDPRGGEEANNILRRFSAERLFFVTGVLPQSMYSVSKLLWLKNHFPQRFAQTKKIMLVCDYLGYLLTGERAIDYSLASRTGGFDIKAKQFDAEILAELGIEASCFSRPLPAGTVVGTIRKQLREELGIKKECVLALGSHDQICSALGAGALNAGDAVDGMGTVECITALFDKFPTDIEMGKQGYVCVPYAVNGLYCTYMFDYSCGSLVNWFRKDIMRGYKGDNENFFSYIEQKMTDNISDVLVLPYFAGAATPYMDMGATGHILNLTTRTEDHEIYRAILESCAMEMRLNAEMVEQYQIYVNRAVATGGGANSAKWLQIKSDIQNLPIRTLRSAEGGLCGCAVLQAVAMGTAKDFEEAVKIFVQYGESFSPHINRGRYDNKYRKYKKLYQILKEIK